ncbi:DUF4238 domain-containing protein [Burkholderia gladioli]|uniref:DUF4238 domain-containing protein n=1 Tax=Burkholderia gladioli TaxID=28095 RepID=UPI00163ED3C0|nr:DUF4238 domain-containing protein [Burkholderia gladioli]
MSKAKKKNPPGRHHFLPQFFIKRFSQNDDQTVYVYDKKYDHLGSIPQHPMEICYREHLYSLGSAGNRFPFLEEVFSLFETKWADVFQMLDQDLLEANTLLLDENAVNLVRFFYTCQFWRSPRRRDLAYETADRLMALYDDMDKPKYLLAQIERKDLKRIVKLKASVDNMKIIQNFLFPLMTYMTPVARDAKFHVIKKPMGYDLDLLCADVGVVGETIEDVFSGDDVKFFPFSSRRLLVVSRGVEEITADAIDQFQKLLFTTASQHIFCATQDGLTKHVNRFRGNL